MAAKWKRDGKAWTGERFGTGRESKVIYPIAGVSTKELAELASKTWLDTHKNDRKRRGKAIIELAKRDGKRRNI